MENCPQRCRHRWNEPLSERVCVIVNPAAGRGLGAKMWPEIRSVFAAHGVTHVLATSGWRNERNLAEEAIGAGFTTLVCVGGDGTTGNVANAILHSGTNARLGVIPAGTGNDFAKTLGTDGKSLHMVARRAVESATARVDVGRVEDVFFLNSCGFGFDVAVLQGLGDTRWLKGNAVYLAAALRQLFWFRGLNLTVETTAITRKRALHMMLLIANSPWFGGGLLIAPSALVNDGELDAVAVHDVSAFRRMRTLASVALGRHADLAEVHIERAAGFTVHFDATPYFEADGEVHEAKSDSLAIRCIPGALSVITGDQGLRQPKPAPVRLRKSRAKLAGDAPVPGSQ